MRICHIGLNHRSAPVELRERLAVSDTEITTILRGINAHASVRESALLSTCNRVEFTLVTHDPDAAIAVAHEWFAARADIALDSIVEHLYAHIMEDAVHHLFSVASGLDSLVLGEPQILGQVKSSYEHALASGTAGHILHRLYQSTFSAAKRARSNTDIGRQAVNISSCAVELAKHIFGALDEKCVLLIGAGEMAELAARHLRGSGVKDILVANRTLDRASKLAQEFNGHALTLDQLPDYLDAADIVISSTGANTYILLPELVQQAIRKRAGRPLFFVDIAVPRDIDPRVGDIDGVYLYDIDDLQQVVQGNREQRQQEAELARALIREDAAKFLTWLKSLESVPLIRGLQAQAERWRHDEMGKSERYLKDLNPSQQQAVERLSRALMKRFLHTSLRTLKSLPEDMEGDLLMGAARKLFELDKPKPESLPEKHEHSSR
ncbi:MAG: glutamyl-tRNA reductase [Mariprofundaceae bacterium]